MNTEWKQKHVNALKQMLEGIESGQLVPLGFEFTCGVNDLEQPDGSILREPSGEMAMTLKVRKNDGA